VYKIANIYDITVCVITDHVQTADMKEKARADSTLMRLLGKERFIGDFA
jgi:hypothetical protein